MYNLNEFAHKHKYIVTYSIKHKRNSICYTWFHVGNPQMRIIFYDINDVILFVKRSLIYFYAHYGDYITETDFDNERESYIIYDLSIGKKILLDKYIQYEKVVDEGISNKYNFNYDILECDFMFSPYIHTGIYKRTNKAGWGCSKRKRVCNRIGFIQSPRERSILFDIENRDILKEYCTHDKIYNTANLYGSCKTNKTNHKMTITGTWKRDFKCRKQWMKHKQNYSYTKLSKEIFELELEDDTQ